MEEEGRRRGGARDLFSDLARPTLIPKQDLFIHVLIHFCPLGKHACLLKKKKKKLLCVKSCSSRNMEFGWRKERESESESEGMEVQGKFSRWHRAQLSESLSRTPT